jgi:hypothetical protein
MSFMKEDRREIQRKRRILEHAAETGNVCRSAAISGSAAPVSIGGRLRIDGMGKQAWSICKPIPKNPANKTVPEIEEKVLHLRRTYHLGPMRIVWYLKRYHDIRISDANVYRILHRNGLNRLPRGTRMRKIHTQRYSQQVPGHQIQVDVKFLTFIGKKGGKIRRYQYTAIDDATRIPLMFRTRQPRPGLTSNSLGPCRSSSGSPFRVISQRCGKLLRC